MANINPIISIITLNVNSPDARVKRYRLLNLIKKQNYTESTLNHKISINKFKWIEIVESMFPDKNRIKL